MEDAQRYKVIFLRRGEAGEPEDAYPGSTWDWETAASLLRRLNAMKDHPDDTCYGVVRAS